MAAGLVLSDIPVVSWVVAVRSEWVVVGSAWVVVVEEESDQQWVCVVAVVKEAWVMVVLEMAALVKVALVKEA
jgi:hypothetical protein